MTSRSIRFQRAGESQIYDCGYFDPHLNLLAHAQLIELEIGSSCGGHGQCGGDRVRLPAGAAVSPLSAEEREHLTTEEIAAGWRLACQCFPEETGPDGAGLLVNFL